MSVSHEMYPILTPFLFYVSMEAPLMEATTMGNDSGKDVSDDASHAVDQQTKAKKRSSRSTPESQTKKRKRKKDSALSPRKLFYRRQEEKKKKAEEAAAAAAAAAASGSNLAPSQEKDNEEDEGDNRVIGSPPNAIRLSNSPITMATVRRTVQVMEALKNDFRLPTDSARLEDAAVPPKKKLTTRNDVVRKQAPKKKPATRNDVVSPSSQASKQAPKKKLATRNDVVSPSSQASNKKKKKLAPSTPSEQRKQAPKKKLATRNDVVEPPKETNNAPSKPPDYGALAWWLLPDAPVDEGNRELTDWEQEATQVLVPMEYSDESDPEAPVVKPRGMARRQS